MIKNWRWFISKTLRETLEDRKQILKMLDAQRDLLGPEQIETLETAIADLDQACQGPVEKEPLLAAREAALQTADGILIPYPDAKYRDWIEMFLVVAALVLAFRTFFFQPFKIPTGSMQPTLFGITHVNLIDAENQPVPGKGGRIVEWFRGGTWYHLKAEGNWRLRSVSSPTTAKLTRPYGSIKLTFEDVDNPSSGDIVRKVWYTWFDNPPYVMDHLNQSGIRPLIRMPDVNAGPNMITKDEFAAGEDVFKFQVRTGDHLFVNRITYNFRHPKPGDISVFKIKYDDVTVKSPQVPSNDTFYIKRLVAMGGSNVTIGPDRHLIINGKRVDSSHPGFEFIYSHPKLTDGTPVDTKAINSEFSGHQPPEIISEDLNLTQSNNPWKVPAEHCVMLGDNTDSSLDSRYWGAIPKRNIIGISSFVYWPPLSSRFGWSHR